MKIGIIGAGFVGAACAKAMLLRGSCEHIVLNDIVTEKARGLANDLSHGELLCPATRIEAGSISDLSNSDIIVITAGINERSGGAIDRNDKRGRLLLLPDNAAIYKNIIPQIARAAPKAIILVVTDPPDALADVAKHLLPNASIVSTGTYLDSLRFRLQIARRLECHPASVEANVIGEHGTSQVYVWSTAQVGGESVLRLAEAKQLDPVKFRNEVESAVKYANIEIIEGIGASQHGIGIVTARLVEAMLRDERMVVPVGTFHTQYGVTLSLPSVLGARGVTAVLDITLDEVESRALSASADTLREAHESILHMLE
ncbi:MAG: lactate dehydrogenase [candidate division Zixibacteria bacterium]|nr:lactate dehydrogenase [candidate division Zixibacteria bacterium]